MLPLPGGAAVARRSLLAVALLEVALLAVALLAVALLSACTAARAQSAAAYTSARRIASLIATNISDLKFLTCHFS